MNTLTASEMQRAEDVQGSAEILSLKTVALRLDAWMVWNNAELPPQGDWL